MPRETQMLRVDAPCVAPLVPARQAHRRMPAPEPQAAAPCIRDCASRSRSGRRAVQSENQADRERGKRRRILREHEIRRAAGPRSCRHERRARLSVSKIGDDRVTRPRTIGRMRRVDGLQTVNGDARVVGDEPRQRRAFDSRRGRHRRHARRARERGTASGRFVPRSASARTTARIGCGIRRKGRADYRRSSRDLRASATPSKRTTARSSRAQTRRLRRARVRATLNRRSPPDTRRSPPGGCSTCGRHRLGISEALGHRLDRRARRCAWRAPPNEIPAAAASSRRRQDRARPGPEILGREVVAADRPEVGVHVGRFDGCGGVPSASTYWNSS